MLRLAIGPVAQFPEDDASPREAAADDAAGDKPPPGGPAWLSDDERRRLATLAGPAREAFVASRALTRRVLAEATGVAAGRWRLSAPAGRTPEASVVEAEVEADVAGEIGAGPDDSTRVAPAAVAPHEGALRVSLAHRLGWIVAAVADGDVGVDIECERPVRASAAERAALMLTAEEIARWRALPEPEREPALLCAWVAKEAWYKAVPAGTAPWDFRRVTARPCAPAQANVRVWSARPLWVGLCRDDAAALAAVRCDGLPGDVAVEESWWRVARAPLS
jgi:phosphopantetheinyl transferase